MQALPYNQEPIFIGVDGSGAQCRVVIIDKNKKMLGRSNGAPVKHYRNFAQAKHSVLLTIGDALRNAGLKAKQVNNSVIGFSLNKINLDTVHQAVNQWQLDCRDIFITTDLQAANFAAHELEGGAVIILDSGCRGFTNAGGRALSIGGRGFMLGDKSSGAWLGYSAVQAMMAEMDGLGPKTQLSSLIEHYFGITSGPELITRLNSATQSDYTALAHLVFDAANDVDFIANWIIEDGVSHIESMLDKLCEAGATRISILGSIGERFLPYFPPRVQTMFSPALNPPELGAALFAHQQFSINMPHLCAYSPLATMLHAEKV